MRDLGYYKVKAKNWSYIPFWTVGYYLGDQDWEVLGSPSMYEEELLEIGELITMPDCLLSLDGNDSTGGITV
jgi:hypothetical protein